MADDDSAIRIVIADGQTMFRAALRRVLESTPGLRVEGEADNGPETVRLAKELKPDILILDLNLPTMSGMQVMSRLSGIASVRKIVLSATIEKHQLLEALQHGAHGIILKNVPVALLIRVIREVKAGEYWLDRAIVSDFVQALRAGAVPQHQQTGDGDFHLTERERKIVAAVVDGLTNKDIARHFSISEQTVKHHLTNIFKKVGVFNRLELALFALDRGLVA